MLRTLVLLTYSLACASGAPSVQLDSVYEPGADRTDGAKRTQRQHNKLVFSRLRDSYTGDLELSGDLRAALGSRLSTAIGYDAYDVRVKRGQGYSASWSQYCDYVFFDASQRIVASYRREGNC